MPTLLTPGDGQDILARYKAAREQRDPDAAVELFRENAELRPDPFEPVLAGSLAIRERWTTLAAEQVHVAFDPERVWVSARTVLASWHGAFTRRATGERVRQRGFMSLDIDLDGRIGRMREWTLERVVGLDGTFEPEDAEGGR